MKFGKMTMQKLVTCAAVLLCAALFAVPVSALDRDHGYIIKDYAVSAVLHEDNTVTQTETIVVDFLTDSHGIFRAFPTTYNVKQSTPDGDIMLPYNAKVKNIDVPGYKFNEDTDNGVHMIRIGDEDETLYGEQVYTLSFTFDIGDDRTEDYDSIFYSLLGADVTTTVEHCSFELILDKPLPDGTEITMYSGPYGSSEDSGKIRFTSTASGVNGETIIPLEAGEAITAHAKLPEGYFVGERSYSSFPGWVLFGIIAVFSLAMLIYSLSVRHKKPVVTVEFYPPEGVSSAEVGYIVDSAADDKDILSLIFYFAEKGYCTISGEGDAMSITKLKQLENAPSYMQTFFDALFEKGDVCKLDDPGADFYNKLQATKGLLGAEFTGKRALYSTGKEALSLVLPILLCIMYFVANIVFTYALSGGAIALALVSGLCMLGAVFTAFFAARKWTFASFGAKAGFSVGMGILSAFGLGAAVLADYFASTVYIMPSFIVISLYLITLLGALSFVRISVPTAYCTEISGKLLGLKNFISKAELPRIELLVSENPSYFYDVLPFAYVFGLSDTWVKQFETLATPTPTWYVGNNMSMYSLYWLTRSMNHSYGSMIQNVTAANMHTGSTGGSSFGGGGGFSGGGFGGGGTGRW